MYSNSVIMMLPPTGELQFYHEIICGMVSEKKYILQQVYD